MNRRKMTGSIAGAAVVTPASQLNTVFTGRSKEGT
jgi:hypothetical protein